MTEDKSPGAERDYIAFISYRHRPLDAEAARRIQKRIESYTVPKEYRARTGGKRLGVVFRDEDELPASSSLSGSITYALDHSKFLLVICTPDLPKSQWCEQEIRYFLQTHDRDHLLAVLVDGSPEESFSPLMLHSFDEQGNITGDTEPIAANIVGENHSINRKAFRKEIVRIFAAMLGCPFDALWQRQRRARTNRLLALMAAGMALLAVFAGVVLTKNHRITEQNVQITEQNEQITEQNEQITRQYLQISEQNEQITEQNEQISSQNLELQRQLSSIRVEAGLARLRDHDVRGALRSALEALPAEEGQPYDRRAETLLAEALEAYRERIFQSEELCSQSANIVDLAVTRDGSLALTVDAAGYVRCISVNSGSLLWETLSRGADSGADASPKLLLPEDSALVLCKNTDAVCALDLESGETVWRFSYTVGTGNNFHCLSPDGKRLLLIDQEQFQNGRIELLSLDTATGELIGQTSLGDEEHPLELDLTGYHYGFGAGFSDDGKLFCYIQRDGEDRFFCALVDLETGQVRNTTEYPRPNGASAEFCGVRVQNGSGDLFIAQYEFQYGGLVTSRICWERGEVARELTNKTVSGRNGLTWFAHDEHLLVPMLASDHLAVVFVQESMYLFDLSTGELRKGYAFGGNILYAAWIDRREEQALIITDDGAVSTYDFGHEGTMAMEGMIGDDLDLTALALAHPLRGQDRTAFLLVPAEQQGRLLAGSYVSDPDAATVPLLHDGYGSRCRVETSPSGQRIFFFLQGADDTRVVVWDAAARAQIGVMTIPRHYAVVPKVLDDESVVFGRTVYRMDGTEQYLDRITDSNADSFENPYAQSLNLSDGRCLSAYFSPYRSSLTLIPCWLDGKLVDASQDPETGIAFRSCKELSLGRNGFVLGYGDLAENDAEGKLLPSRENAYYAFDAREGRRLRLEDPFPESSAKDCVLGTETPVMACWDEEGRVCLLSLRDGSSRMLELGYHPGEIQTLCFTPGDTRLAVLTRGLRLDIYDLAAGERVFSEAPSSLQEATSSSYIRKLSCQTDRSGERLLFLTDYLGDDYGFFLVVDPESWTLLGQATQVYAYSAADDGVYARRGETLVRYPLHRLDDLAAAARARLG